MFSLKTPTLRVLVADDDPVTRRLVSSIVQNQGYQVLAVNDGREAIRALRTDSDFCAAVFDMMMPHLEGIDVARFMTTEKRLMRIPVLMITSEQDLRLMATSFAAGVTLFLSKPFTKEQFLSTFNLLLRTNVPTARRP
jgi:CheY-like chemotaxis protein